MSTKAAYKEKIQAEFDLAQKQLAEFKAEPITLTVDERVLHMNRIKELELKVEAAREHLKQLDEAHEDVWHEIKEGVENAWVELQDEIQKAITKS
ncbi:hypothetical protein JWJ90_19405 [Desulfobulbus rhabdoformis]|uniref:hypothetical protein n=1 Tax=Desulfobulbus rhabdoformis TaxID=34032 RepID=UPI001963A3C4|nr:hypothetical protein [Desulfobulbus rhabdoformis]MBM9616440.1 hypothetical protein [Desulfobulbus rhabdoformis]